MKFKLLISLLIISLFRIDSGISQNDSLRGRVISSISLKRPNGSIYITEKGTTNGVLADSLGYFSLKPLTNREEYVLEISVGNYDMLDYSFKSEWIKREKPKSIVVVGKCELNKEKARKDWGNEFAKLYIIGGIVPIDNTNKDNKFERKFKVEYSDFGCEGKIYECLEEYNNSIFKILDIKYGDKWRMSVRKDVVGINDWIDNGAGKPCIN